MQMVHVKRGSFWWHGIVMVYVVQRVFKKYMAIDDILKETVWFFVDITNQLILFYNMAFCEKYLCQYLISAQRLIGMLA